MVSFTVLVWGGFLFVIALIVALDLGVFHKKAHVVSLPEALGWTAVWVTLALLFNVGVFYLYELNPAGWDMDHDPLTGQQAALQFFTGYVVEKSLSVDNIFVIAMIFAHFRVPLAEQHRVLFWGIFGAVVLRGVMIVAGTALIERFDWILYVLGALLLFSAAMMLAVRHDTIEPEKNWAVRLVRRFYPVTSEFHGSRFFVTIDGQRTATPLLLALVLVETSDVMFAIDSIPAIFAITRDPFIVFTSNVLAILGLRSLYFVLAGLMDKFRFLKNALVILLAFIGVKMMLVHHYPIPTTVSLAVIIGILSVGVLASLIRRDTMALLSPLASELQALAVRSIAQARRAAALLVGSAVVLIGVAMTILPGPEWLVIPLGLVIMSLQFAWAARWLATVRNTLSGTRQRSNRDQTDGPLPPSEGKQK